MGGWRHGSVQSSVVQVLAQASQRLEVYSCSCMLWVMPVSAGMGTKPLLLMIVIQWTTIL